MYFRILGFSRTLTESWIVASHRPAEHTRAINEHTLSLHLRGVSEAPRLTRRA